VAQQNFDPFGAGGLFGSGALQFTGHERDQANLGGGVFDLPDYMHARYYDKVGRFLSVDPMRNSARPPTPQSWNRYTYALNNPLLFIDSDGRDVVLAPGLSRADERRTVTALAKASRNQDFSRRLAPDASSILVILSTASLRNDFLANPKATNGTVQYGSTTIDKKRGIRFCECRFSRKTTTPMSDIQDVAHEFDHTNNYLTPAGKSSMVTNPQKEEADALRFGQTVEADPATKAKATRKEEEAIKLLLEPRP
jgi:RHS repeat-associated protein